ncbi:hypothetical protein DXG01_004830 [Tephrocybe rancida]|nr:hypothetical protein DXG01_004830 [Tephrocybe rancida]
MELVSAVQIANLCVTSQSKIAVYNRPIFRYAKCWHELFPDEDLKPVIYAVLHIGDIMELFGPVHTYSSPFYKRYINFFHRINTNKKLGRLESTFMKMSTRAANLCALLLDDVALRESVVSTISKMEQIKCEDACGYRLANLLDPSLPDYVMDTNALLIELSDDVLRPLHEIIATFYGPECQF